MSFRTTAVQCSFRIFNSMNHTELLKRLGKKIKTLRSRKNMTQNELAIKCEFEKASLSRIESGRTNITVRTLYKISKALDVPIIEMFNDEAE